MCSSLPAKIKKRRNTRELLCLLLNLLPNRDYIQSFMKNRTSRHNLVASPTETHAKTPTWRFVWYRGTRGSGLRGPQRAAVGMDAALGGACRAVQTRQGLGAVDALGDRARRRHELSSGGVELCLPLPLEVAATPWAEGSSFSVNGFVSALTNAVSAIAGAQLAASSFGP